MGKIESSDKKGERADVAICGFSLRLEFLLAIVCAGMPGAIVGGVITWRRRRHLYGVIFGWISGLLGAVIGLLLVESHLPHPKEPRPPGPAYLREEVFSALRIDGALLGSAVLGWLSSSLVWRRRKGNNVKPTNIGGITMSSTVQSFGIDRLPREQRIALVLDIWDTIAAESGKPLLTDAQRRELERRIAEDNVNQDNVIPWEQVKAQTLSRLKP